MSLLPHSWDNTYWPMTHPRWDMDINRDFWRADRDMWHSMNRMMTDLNRATRRLRGEAKDIEADINCDKDKFQARIDCHNFRPEEVVVRTLGKDICIDAKHEERQDEHGFTSRTFTRRYRLPEDCCTDNVKCDMSSDGILCINVPRQPALLGGEKLLEIKQTGKPALPA